MPQKRTYKGAQVIAIIIAILLLCVAGFCAYLLIDNQQQKAEQKELFATIAEKVDAAENELGDLEQISTVEDKRVAQLLEVYGELHNYNSDFVGWIRVPGTEINGNDSTSFDDFRETLSSYGMDRIVEIYQAAYDRYLAR